MFDREALAKALFLAGYGPLSAEQTQTILDEHWSRPDGEGVRCGFRAAADHLGVLYARALPAASESPAA